MLGLQEVVNATPAQAISRSIYKLLVIDIKGIFFKQHLTCCDVKIRAGMHSLMWKSQSSYLHAFGNVSG